MSYPVIPITTLVPQQSVTSQAIPVPNVTGPVTMMFLNDGSCLLNVVNTNDTYAYVISVLAVPDMAGRTGTTTTPTGYAVTIPAYTTALIPEVYLGPFRQAWWNQTTGDVGYVYVTFTGDGVHAISDLTVEVINF